LIYDSNKYSRDQAGVSGQIAELVTKHGGEMLASRLWEERRLAYPINGQRKGTYWLTYFKLDSRKLIEVKNECRLSESILRTLFLKVDPRIADALVSHALSGGKKEPAPAAEPRDTQGNGARTGGPRQAEPVEPVGAGEGT
jgi:small subunit ribosomal protein S6